MVDRDDFKIEPGRFVYSGSFRILGGYYGSYNGHWGLGLRATDKTTMSGIAPRDRVLLRKDLYHIGRLIYFKPDRHYFRVYPISYSPNKKAFINEETRVTIKPEELLGRIGFITGNNVTGAKMPPMFNDLDYIGITFIILHPGDAFAVPFSPLVVRMDEAIQPGDFFTIDSKGKFVVWNEGDSRPRLGVYLMNDKIVNWYLFMPETDLERALI